jgi:uncharacterized protein involved in outer membrane biogenesis
MTLPFRIPSLKTCVRIVLLCALATLLLVFDWNWFREPLVAHLAERSQRRVEIDDLQVGIDASLEPTVRLRGVRIDNAPWADTRRPLALAAEAAFTFSWRSLVEWRPVVSRLKLVDAEIDLERRADGLRNWRLRQPDDRGPGQVKVLSLLPERTRIRFLHQSLGLDLTATASDLPEPATLARHPLPMPRRIDIRGDLGDIPFTFQAEAAERLTFIETGEAFPLRGHAATGKARLAFEGTVADLFDPSTVDATLRLGGPDLGQLGKALSAPLPDTPPYEVQAELRKEKVLPDYTFTQLRATIGASELTGSVDYDPGGDRPILRATLAGERVRLADLRAADKGADGSGPSADTASPWPRTPISPESWRRLDAHVELKLKAFQADGSVPLLLTGVRASAHLEDGALEIAPFHFNLAGGQATLRLALDTRQEPPGTEAEFTLRQWRLEKLLPDLDDNARITGPLSGQLRLKARGRSLAAMAASANGSAEFTLEGGSLARTLESRLALDGGKLLRGLFSSERQVAMRCGVLAFDFKRGQGTARQVWLETEQTQTRGSGRIDLGEQNFELLLAPHSKDDSLFALNKPLRVHGSSFTEAPKVGLSDRGAPAAGPAGCKLNKTPVESD